jgi:CheY-like chemotaxis protein
MERQKTILTIENQPENLPLLRKVVERLPETIDFYSLNINEVNYDDFLTLPHSPSLIFLNLDLDEVEISSLIKRIKHFSNCQLIPLILLTPNCSPDLVHKYYCIGINGLVYQPTTEAGLLTTLELVCEYWFKVVVLPY